MDPALNMSHQVNHVCKTAVHAIRKIGQIRQYLDQDATTRLVHAFVTSRLDSCNSLLFGLSEREISKIQRVQNIAARLVARTPRHVHITPVLHELHWLPIRQRLAYKILLLVFKALNGLTPKYITDMVQVYIPSRALRSTSTYRLKQVIPSTKTFRCPSLELHSCYPAPFTNFRRLQIQAQDLSLHVAF